jgi:c(7)-type cytochrome triheme protein
MNQRLLFVLGLMVIFCGHSLSQTGTKQKRPLPYQFGRVILNNYSEKAYLSSVVFEQWIHRSKFTCRVCHLDIGFTMKTGQTGISAVDNERGYYLGAGRIGKSIAEAEPVFAACFDRRLSYEDKERCDRCHSFGKKVASDFDFFAFSQSLPKERFRNGVDWERSEAMGLINPASFLNRFSFPKPSLAAQKYFELNSKVERMPEIVFSHKKHTVLNGCQLRNPGIFMGGRKGNSGYTMVDISEGKSCGACRVTVAFSLTDCQRCHTKSTQPEWRNLC